MLGSLQDSHQHEDRGEEGAFVAFLVTITWYLLEAT